MKNKFFVLIFFFSTFLLLACSDEDKADSKSDDTNINTSSDDLDAYRPGSLDGSNASDEDNFEGETSNQITDDDLANYLDLFAQLSGENSELGNLDDLALLAQLLGDEGDLEQMLNLFNLFLGERSDFEAQRDSEEFIELITSIEELEEAGDDEVIAELLEEHEDAINEFLELFFEELLASPLE